MADTLDFRLGLVPEIRLPIGAGFGVEFTFTGLDLTGYTGIFTARKSSRKSANPLFWTSDAVTIGADSASFNFAPDDLDDNSKAFSSVLTLVGIDYALSLYDGDGALVLRLQGIAKPIDATGAFDQTEPANASFEVAVGESVSIPVSVTMASSGADEFDLPATIHAATAKGSIATNDEFAISDSASSWGLKKVTWATISAAVGGLITSAISALGLGNSATRNVGTVAGTVAAGDDSRMTDSRTPTAHKTSHATGGADALTPADIGAATAAHTHDSITGGDPSGNWYGIDASQWFFGRGFQSKFAVRGVPSTDYKPTPIAAEDIFYSWVNSTNVNVGTIDTALGRLSAGHVIICDGVAANLRDFSARTIIASGAVRHPSYTVSAALALVGMQAGDTIYVSDEVGGACLATYNGSEWKRQTDLATIS